MIFQKEIRFKRKWFFKKKKFDLKLINYSSQPRLATFTTFQAQNDETDPRDLIKSYLKKDDFLEAFNLAGNLINNEVKDKGTIFRLFFTFLKWKFIQFSIKKFQKKTKQIQKKNSKQIQKKIQNKFKQNYK